MYARTRVLHTLRVHIGILYLRVSLAAAYSTNPAGYNKITRCDCLRQIYNAKHTRRINIMRRYYDNETLTFLFILNLN